MTKRRSYLNPPIVEAICAIEFEPCEDWSLSSPGGIYSSVRESYPGKPTQNITSRIELINSGTGRDPTFGLKQGNPIIQLSDSTGTRQFSFSQASISVRSLRPYEGWESYKSRLHEAVSAFVAVATPGKPIRLGVRYINQISFEAEEVSLRKYFTSPPVVPKSLDMGITGFTMRIETVRPEGDVTVIHNFLSSVSEDSKPVVILDIDVVRQFSDADTSVDYAEEIERLRDIERWAFEAHVTDEARRLFDGD